MTSILRLTEKTIVEEAIRNFILKECISSMGRINSNHKDAFLVFNNTKEDKILVKRVFRNYYQKDKVMRTEDKIISSLWKGLFDKVESKFHLSSIKGRRYEEVIISTIFEIIGKKNSSVEELLVLSMRD